MPEIGDFGAIILAISGGVMLAVLARKLSERYPIPAPALFLVAAAAIPVVVPDILTVERIGVVALIVILFDGGMSIGWRRFRRAALPIASLGLFGTLATAAVMAGFAHYLFDFSWTTAWILGAALAPTDPAVMFSILGDKQIRGRTGTILEGEAGVNDPVGIALMIGIIEFATSDSGSFWGIVKEFTLEMTIGLAVGLAGTAALVRSASLVDLAPGLVIDLPPPAMWLIAFWYAGWVGMLVARRMATPQTLDAGRTKLGPRPARLDPVPNVPPRPSTTEGLVPYDDAVSPTSLPNPAWGRAPAIARFRAPGHPEASATVRGPRVGHRRRRRNRRPSGD